MSMAGQLTLVSIVGEIIDLAIARATDKVEDQPLVDYTMGFRPCPQPEFQQRLANMRASGKTIVHRPVMRGGKPLGRVYLASGEPEAFYGTNGTYYVRMR
jgi:hypothetical protein